VARLTVEAAGADTLQARALGAGQWRLEVQGSAGRVFTLQGSPDLFHWARLGRHTNASGTLVLTNAPAKGRPAYFYRTVVLPPPASPASPAPRLTGVHGLPDGRMRFDLEAAAGSPWRVEGSPDLEHWGQYGLVTNTSAVRAITNTPWGRPRAYFFRVTSP
jgi:hypothetical protein